MSTTITLNDHDVELAELPNGELGVVLADLNTAAGRDAHSNTYVLRLRSWKRQHADYSLHAEPEKVQVPGRGGRGTSKVRVVTAAWLQALVASFADESMRAVNRAQQLTILRECVQQLEAAKPVTKTKRGARDPLVEALTDALEGVTLSVGFDGLTEHIEDVVRRVVREELTALAPVIREELTRHAKLGTATTTLGFIQNGGAGDPSKPQDRPRARRPCKSVEPTKSWF